jgi:hypothetical protein
MQMFSSHVRLLLSQAYSSRKSIGICINHIYQAQKKVRLFQKLLPTELDEIAQRQVYALLPVSLNVDIYLIGQI